MAQYGYDRERFVNLPTDGFQCIICSQIVREPWECHQCGKMFCKSCITDWMKKNPSVKCPLKCNNSKIQAVASKALMRMYNDLDVKCSNPKCNKVIKLMDLEKHESICLKVKCWNFENCEKVQDENIKCEKPCCSSVCQLLYGLHSNFGNNKKMYQLLEPLLKNLKGSDVNLSPIKTSNHLSWDPLRLGTGIIAEENNSKIFLKEQSYVFRSAVGNVGFTGGVNYWEIIADPRTENQLKIGVTTNRDFDLNSAFCDHPFGFAYYGLGQLRHNSNASGPAYGKRFKKEGILGCCLDMNKGTLHFAFNGEYWGEAYSDPKLKQGPIYPAVSLLHCAGCKIRSGLPVPSYFKL